MYAFHTMKSSREMTSNTDTFLLAKNVSPARGHEQESKFNKNLSCPLCRHSPLRINPNQAARSRLPKSRLESRMEEEKQARARVSDRRIPVVSRPTNARTNHMAEVARARSMTGGSVAECGRMLPPHYPTSTLNPPVPRALEEAFEATSRRDSSFKALRLAFDDSLRAGHTG